MNKIIPILNTPDTSSVKNNTTAKSSSFQAALVKETKKPDSLNLYFEQAAKKYQIPVELLKAMGKAESDFNPNAVSSCGAQGVMQLMPATAKTLGVTNAFDPEQNIMGGAKYIATLLDRYDGNVKLAVAAYNAGSGNVHKYGGIPPFKETQNYVKKVCAYMKETIVVPESGPVSPNLNHLGTLTSSTPTYQGQYGSTSLSASGQTASSLPSALLPPSNQPEEEAKILTIEDQLEQFSYSDYLLLIKLSGLLFGAAYVDSGSPDDDAITPNLIKSQQAARGQEAAKKQEVLETQQLPDKQESAWSEYPGISPAWKTYLSLNPTDTSQTI